MTNKRQVNFRVLFDLLKSKRPTSIVGIIFILLPIFALVPLVFLFSMIFRGANDGYDLKTIEKNGIEKDARITYIKTLYNISINEEHPVLISYEYEINGKTVKDKFETLDLEKIADFKLGTNIKVIAYQNQAIIKDVEPFSFPIKLFYSFPGLFFIIGAVLLLIGLIPALKIYNLYKTGIIKEAFVVSIESNIGIMPLQPYKGTIKVNYYFLDEYKNKVFGDCSSTDFLLLMEKKAGDTIKIFVSENDETKSCVVPRYEAMKYNWSI